MMQRQSPPKHRHDGTSPLPLGMDWSPPPKKWAGRETVWPHDPHTGWSYCVTVPSWVNLPKSRESDPIVFYRVLVGIQSADGITCTRVVLRRFNDFLKFHAALKKAFPGKNLPQAPPKGLLRMKARALLEERRRSLEECMTKLLSDIDLSRSFFVASFLELEAAARSSFQDENQQSSELNPSANRSTTSSQFHLNSNSNLLAGSSSLTSDYGSDTAYEASDIGSATLALDNNSEVDTGDFSLDEDLASPLDKFMKYGMANIDEGLFMGQAILEQLEGFPKHKVLAGEVNNVARNNMPVKNGGLARKSSVEESIGSDASSKKSSEHSNPASRHALGNEPIEPPRGSGVSRSTEDIGNSDLLHPVDIHLVLPLNQGQKINRILTNMQQKLITAKTDMEDLLSRFNQENAVKEYLATKVKDLEVELETTRQKSKDNIEQAILLERERVTQMQWDMEELRRKSIEMELKLNSRQEDKKIGIEASSESNTEKKEILFHELDVTRRQLENLSKQYEELEVKSKADIRVLVKEVKSLRTSQAVLKQQLNQSFHENSRIEILLHKEREKNEHTSTVWKKLLEECEILYNQLANCKVNLVNVDEEDDVMNFPSASESLSCAVASDEQIDHLLAKAKHFFFKVDQSAYLVDSMTKVSEDLRKMLITTFVDYCRLRKHTNMASRNALRLKMLASKDNNTSTNTNNVVQSVDLDR